MMTDTGVEPDAWGYLIVCVPIVVIFAPLGSILSSHFHRQVLATLVYILDTVALITALVVIPLTLSLGIMWYVVCDLKMFLILQIFSGCLLLGGFVFFFILSKAGQRLMKSYQAEDAHETEAVELNFGVDV